MNPFIDLRDPPPKRRLSCDDNQEKHFTEAAVMIAFALYLLENGATAVELHPDGEHGKRHDLKVNLESHGFSLNSPIGTTQYGGVYRRGRQTLTIALRPGLGDVIGRIGDQTVVAECKGGIINTRHSGQASKLRKGLFETIGMLLTRPLAHERLVVVMPATIAIRRVAIRVLPRVRAAGIEIALVEESGEVSLLQ